ncbi:MAG: hypothetical protein KJS97_08595 [Alphaproteobacteria bacterium]|nr:hypothetical protein [Alphaproteobacteria bacterium]
MLSRWFLAAAILAAPALAAQDPAALTYAQRRALLAADEGCNLLEQGPRAALSAMTSQSRAVLVRAGWTPDRLATLDRDAVRAGRSHACNAPVLADAAASARAGYEGWRRLSTMTFPGQAASWTSRRTPDPDGWIVWQDAPGAPGVRLGVRETETGAELVFSVPDPVRASGARLRVRDPARAPQPGFDAPGRAKARLSDRLPMPTESTAIFASSRRIEAGSSRTPARTVFAFDNSAFERLVALDTREAIGVELPTPEGGVRTYLIEVGDLAAARAFAALR